MRRSRTTETRNSNTAIRMGLSEEVVVVQLPANLAETAMMRADEANRRRNSMGSTVAARSGSLGSQKWHPGSVGHFTGSGFVTSVGLMDSNEVRRLQLVTAQ